MTKQEYNLIIDSHKSNSTCSVNLRDSILLLNKNVMKNQKKYEIQPKCNANIDSNKSITLNSEYLVDTISLSNIENQPIIDDNYTKKKVIK